METKIRRKQELKESKNYLPTIAIIAALWIAVVGFIFLIDPTIGGVVPLFFVLVFMTISFTASILFANTRRGILCALLITGYLGLRVVGLDTIFNIVVFIAALFAFEVYFSKKI